MAYSNGFSGDSVSLDVIVKTSELKNPLEPGIFTHPALTVTAMGELAYFYTRGARTRKAIGNVGDKIDFTVKGVHRIDVPITKSLSIEGVIPNVNHETVSADVVADVLVDETDQQTNEFIRAVIQEMDFQAESKTYTAGADAYDVAVAAIQEFKTDNAFSNLKPTGFGCSPSFWGNLMLSERFRNSSTISDSAYGGLIKDVLGVKFVELIDMAGADADFLVVAAKGVCAVKNVNSVEIEKGALLGYPGGTAIIGEIGFGIKVLTSADDASLYDSAGAPSGYFVSKYVVA